MSVPIISRISENTNTDFNTSINVAGHTVSVGTMTGGNEPDVPVVTFRTAEEDIAFTPTEACALAAALQAVAVHLMESEPREIRRTTEPGAPAFEESI